jgi:hypothetical protein
MHQHGPLRRDGRKQGIPSPGKDREHSIPLGVHHLTLGFPNGGTEQPLMSGENLRVSVTQLLQEACGPLDVGEEEGDGPRRQAGHEPPVIDYLGATFEEEPCPSSGQVFAVSAYSMACSIVIARPLAQAAAKAAAPSLLRVEARRPS